ncbi:bifunctional helix-turn-helix transcriptional regulator/GNAT family N-acetyltransferase [Pseudomonadales bacterium]|nr:bifunctional helix-turn-helix transcriptional regulator/GNAT family N-acetyltransferase [Pseudomonadales bacterium]
MDLIKDLGSLGLASRLKRLSDKIMQDGIRVYRESGVDFEPRWFPLYQYLDRFGPSPVMDIARGLGITHPAVNQVAGQMVQARLIAPYRDARDKRRRLLALTSEGRALKPVLTSLWSSISVAVNGVLDESQVAFLKDLDAIEAALDRQGLYARLELAGAVAADRARPDRARPDRSPPELVIEGFQPVLADTFRRINEEWITEYFKLETADQKTLRDPHRSILEAGGDILFVRDTRTAEILGTCALIKHSESLAELAKMGVTKQARGRGAGLLLVQAIIHRASELGFQRLFLETNARLEPALKIYRQVGFEQCEPPRPSDYERSDVYMKLALTNSLNTIKP